MEVRPVCRHEPSATRPPRLSDWVGWSLFLLLWVAAPALAADANGSAYGARLGLSADVLGLGSATATLTETPQVAGVGPADYALADTVLGVQVGLLGTEVLNTGVLTVSTDHSAAVPTANSTSSVDDVSVNLQVTPLLQLLTLTADAVQAEAAITGVCGALQATGSTTLVNAQVRNLLGQTITLDTQPTANLEVDLFSALGIAGVRLFINEQSESGDAFNRQISVNAIRIQVDASVALASLSGEIVIGHAEAARSCAAGDGPDLTVSKAATPNPATVGEALLFTIDVSNVGNQPAQSVQVVDTLDASFSLLDATTSADGSCAAAGQTVTCNWPQIAAGQSRSVQLSVLPTQEGTFVNTAVASFDGPDANPGNDDGSVTVIVDPASGPVTADFSISKSANPDPATVGSPLNYLITLSNAGPDAAPASMTDSLPAGLTADAIVVTGGGSCSGSTAVSCSWPSVAAGASVSVTITVTPQVAGTLLNAASVSADGGAVDPDPGNNVVQIETVVQDPIPTANLSLTKVANPDPATVGQPLVYTLTISNAGPDATGATVTDTLPGGLSASAIVPSDGGVCSGTTTIACSWANIAVGSSVNVQITVNPITTGVLTNTATVVPTGPTIDPDPGDNTTTITTPVQPALPQADLSVSKSANPDPATVGQPLVYTITVANAGPDATGASIIDTLPGGLSAAAIVATDGGMCSGSTTISCSWSAIAAAASVSVQITVTPGSAGVLVNTATVTPSGPTVDPNPGNNTVTIQTTVNPPPPP
ncbi:MAG: DUF11 domain-containing protein, partial [Xanthomonadales bacterium]|nr:DUF11 domain-containing protein [Xanthomonadales bacterium]